jgi:hypothetical protein
LTKEKKMPDQPWFTKAECRAQMLWAFNQMEYDALGCMLTPYPEIVVDELPLKLGDRIETTYVARWANPRQGEDPRIYINGRNRPMTGAELEQHFRQQIEQAVANRKQQN